MSSLPGLLALPVSAGFKLRNGMKRSGQRAGGVVRWSSGRARLRSGAQRKLSALTAIAGVLAGRSSRPTDSFGAHEAFLTVLPVCDRRNERSGSLLRPTAEAEWSEAAAKLASQSSCAGRTVRRLAPKAFGEVSAL
jgi:hypothetical protein